MKTKGEYLEVWTGVGSPQVTIDIDPGCNKPEDVKRYRDKNGFTAGNWISASEVGTFHIDRVRIIRKSKQRPARIRLYVTPE